VVTTEGTHEALAVQFPGGRLERIKPEATPDLTDPVALLANRRRTIASRAAELGFLVRWLGGRHDRRLPSELRIDPDRIGVFGAVGGALAGLQAAYDGVPLAAVAGLPEVVGPADEPWAIERLHSPYDYGNHVGTVDPRRSIRAQRAYLTAFFDLHLRGRDSPLLHHESAAHPDVRLVPSGAG
jgi:hypothetical protein